jgi:cyclic pyranopterin phosphate synthase
MKNNFLDWHLRVTVSPKCNFRCRYCNPDGVFQDDKILKIDEILEIVKASIENNITRVHWTGGEPCLVDINYLINESKKLGIVNQIMTTNGSLRVSEIKKLKESGLDRVNISLDTLDHKKNKIITGKDYFKNTIQWIKASTELFDQPTKMNIVPMADNINEIPNFIRFAQNFNGKLMLKFIELCPNNPAFYKDEIKDFFISREKIIEELVKVGKLKPTKKMGDNPNAEYYQVGDTGVTIILVTMPSQNFKCGLNYCRKMRVSPYGLVGSCIQQKGENLMGKNYEEKVRIIKERINIRENLSDILPVSRYHKRTDYGIWRFGKIESKECSRC